MSWLATGSVVGSFIIEEAIGRSQFGLTYKARHRTLSYFVVIKEFFPRDICERGSDGRVVVVTKAASQALYDEERLLFSREALALTPFRNHRNIITVLDVFDQHATSYIVMEYVEGTSLLHTIVNSETGVLTIASEDAVRRLLNGMLHALETLHGHDPLVLHRDIKPANIMIDRRSGEPILIDFGASRQISAARSHNLTAILTLGYAPYEQYSLSDDEVANRFSSVDPGLVRKLPVQAPPSDIYALGATCYFMLSGKVPAEALLRKARLEDYRPLANLIEGEITPTLLASIDRALALEPGDRFASATDWRTALAGSQAQSAPAVEATESVLPGDAATAAFVRPSKPATYIPEQTPSAQPPHLLHSTDSLAVGAGVIDGAQRPGRLAGLAAVFVLAGAVLLFAVLRLSPERDPTAERTSVGISPAAVISRPMRDCPHCPMMVKVPVGAFTMGSPASETGRFANEGPQRLIQLRRPFALSRTEISVAEWKACVDDGGCSAEPLRRRPDEPLSNPMTQVSWHAAQAYAAWLSRRTKRGYHLPSEAEWEYAARASAAGEPNAPFPWGESSRGAPANCRDCDGAPMPPQVRAVGSFAANRFGLYDMAGNVWEWVEDCARPDLTSVPADGSAFAASNCGERIIRGGGYANPREALRSARRFGIPPDSGADSIGFRVARSE